MTAQSFLAPSSTDCEWFYECDDALITFQDAGERCCIWRASSPVTTLGADGPTPTEVMWHAVRALTPSSRNRCRQANVRCVDFDPKQATGGVTMKLVGLMSYSVTSNTSSAIKPRRVGGVDEVGRSSAFLMTRSEEIAITGVRLESNVGVSSFAKRIRRCIRNADAPTTR